MAHNDIITVTKRAGGRPVGSKTQNTPATIARAFGPMTRNNIKKALEKGDMDITMKVFRFCYGKEAPIQPITLGKIENASEAKAAMKQLLGFVTSGLITIEQAEKIQGMIMKYLECTTLDEIAQRLEKLEAGKDE